MIADGIYFGLSEDDYHADPALGSSDLKAIYIDPVDWQFDRLQGEKEETDALIFGKALHCRVLEGKPAFLSRFCCEMLEDEAALCTVEQLTAFTRERGIAVKSGSRKADIIAAIQNSGTAQPKIWDVMLAEHWAANAGKTELSTRAWKQIETAAQWMQADQTLAVMMADGTFQMGAPEVSIFYSEGGVRLKARLDYLIGHAIIDLKSFAPMYKEIPGYSIIKAIIRQRYDLQAAAYVRAWHRGRELFKSGKVFGDAPEGLLEKVYSRPHPLWIWVFLKSAGAPQPYVRSLSHEELVFDVAATSVEKAITRYREMVEQYGADDVWPPVNPPDALSSSDFPTYFQN